MAFAKDQPEAATDRERIAADLNRELGDAPHIVRRFGQALLWLEARDDRVTVAWVSDLGLRGFLRGLEARQDDAPMIVSRVSPSAPIVSPEDLRNPELLTESQTDAVYLVRAELPDAVIVWERAGDLHSDVAVAAATWEGAERHLSSFVTPDEQVFVAQSVEDFRALSA